MSERDELRDPELQSLLARWSAEVLPEGIDERMLSAYRREVRTAEPWWSRLFTASIRIPLPVAVGLLMLFLVTAALALRPAAHRHRPPARRDRPSPSWLLAPARSLSSRAPASRASSPCPR